jgi:hypothetical protein
MSQARRASARGTGARWRPRRRCRSRRSPGRRCGPTRPSRRAAPRAARPRSRARQLQRRRDAGIAAAHHAHVGLHAFGQRRLRRRARDRGLVIGVLDDAELFLAAARAFQADHTTRKLRNCQGSSSSRGSGTAGCGPSAASSRPTRPPLRPGRAWPRPAPRGGRCRRAPPRRHRGFCSAQAIAPRMPATTCSEVALLYGTSARACAIVRREPYQ